MIGAPVADAIGELCCEQIAGAASEDEKAIVRVTLIVQCTNSGEVLPALS